LSYLAIPAHRFDYSYGGDPIMRFITIKLPRFVSVVVVAFASIFKKKD